MAKIAEKVHKPPLRVNVINFELNSFNASILIPQSVKSYNSMIKVFKSIRYVEINKIHFYSYFSISVLLYIL